MQLDAVAPVGQGVSGRIAEFGNHFWNFRRAERARRIVLDHPVAVGKDLAVGLDGGGRDGLGARFLVEEGADATAMHQLHHDRTALRMDRVGNRTPPRNLFGSVNARRAAIDLAVGTRYRSFGDDQTGARALAIVFDGVGRGHVAVPGAASGHRTHRAAIGEPQLAQRYWTEKVRHETSADPYRRWFFAPPHGLDEFLQRCRRRHRRVELRVFGPELL